ncbi:NADH-quinone oxidoreductase subunit K [Pseudonocardia sp. ICBG601]|uniref:NADH-quinone oxidoreductase subunit K n=1 Tax=Pseudonocardia sp. ICBG601 TaxID=2846759 RepID=UPI0035ABE3DD
MQRSLMRILIGIVVLGHGANLLLQVSGGPPGAPRSSTRCCPEQIADPLPQALALTAIVITFALTTLLLALGYRSWVLVGHDEVRTTWRTAAIATGRSPRARWRRAPRTRPTPSPRTPPTPTSSRRAQVTPLQALVTLPVLLPMWGAATSVVVSRPAPRPSGSSAW